MKEIEGKYASAKITDHLIPVITKQVKKLEQQGENNG